MLITTSPHEKYFQFRATIVGFHFHPSKVVWVHCFFPVYTLLLTEKFRLVVPLLCSSTRSWVFMSLISWESAATISVVGLSATNDCHVYPLVSIQRCLWNYFYGGKLCRDHQYLSSHPDLILNWPYPYTHSFFHSWRIIWNAKSNNIT